MAKKKLLVVDDDEGMRDTLAAVLKHDFRVLKVASGESALGLLSKEEVDIVLLDVRLPGITGLDGAPLRTPISNRPVTDGGIEWMNRSARRMFGGELADFVGESISIVATPELDHPLRRADHHGISISGIHMHIGSGTDLEHLAQVCGSLEKTVLEVGRSVTTISAFRSSGVLPSSSSSSRIISLATSQAWSASRSCSCRS